MDATTLQPQNAQPADVQALIAELEKDFAEFDAKLGQLETDWEGISTIFNRTIHDVEKDLDALEADVKQFETERGADVEQVVLEMIDAEAGNGE